MKKIINYIVMTTGRFKKVWLKVYKPSGEEYADYLRKWGKFYAIGEHCAIYPYTNITDPEYVLIGNNVRLSNCTVLGHDASVVMLNRAFGTNLDRVGKVVLNDNVFVGHGAIILPGVTVGPNAIVAAGAVVSKDVPENSVVAGVPARVIGDVDLLVKKLELETKKVPWYSLIIERGNCFDPKIEPQLKELRVKYFFSKDNN